jgi:hypothetical protein
MAKDAEYHTSRLEYGPREQNVYHDHNACREGSKIKLEHRTLGRGTGRRLCEICQGLS